MAQLLTCVLLVLASLVAQDPVLVANYATQPQRGWVFVALPESPKVASGWLTDHEKQLVPYVAEDGGMRAWVSLDAGEQRKLTFLSGKPREGDLFRWHPVVEATAMRLLPHWTLGDETGPPAQLTIASATDAHVRVHMRTVFAARRVTVDCWLTVTSGEPTIEWVQSATYGDTRNDGQPQSVVLPPLRMHSEGRPHIDEWSRNGFGMASFAEGNWTQVCVPDQTRWHRASRFVARGAIMAASDPARLEGRPLVGLYLGWQGSWGPLGVVPQPTAHMVNAAKAQRAAWQARLWSSYLGPRPEDQPGYAGTTGEQPGFGWASHWAVSLGEPWQILDGLWQTESYCIRPTGNKEPDGSPMLAAKHPLARTMNQRPDLSLGREDRLGWPGVNQIAWIPSPASVTYSTESDEHRSCANLAGTYLLTRDPVLRSVLFDQCQLDATDDYVRGRRVMSGRAIGRLALAGAWSVWLGFPEAIPPLQTRLDAALDLRDTLWPEGVIRPVGAPEFAKRGWVDASGQDKPGWQPWQQAIAMGGFRAAGFALANDRYLKVSKELAGMILDSAFQVQGAKLHHSYAQTFNGGALLPAEAWPTMGDRREAFSEQVYVTPDTGFWSACAGLLMLSHPMAKPALEAFPVRSTIEARWRALR